LNWKTNQKKDSKEIKRMMTTIENTDLSLNPLDNYKIKEKELQIKPLNASLRKLEFKGNLDILIFKFQKIP